MADNLPDPKSRKESYLAKAAGMDVEIPEKPESREEQYLNAIAEGGGGGGSDINVVQTTGTSTTDVMSQNATTGMVYHDDTKTCVQIGLDASASRTSNNSQIAIGKGASATGSGYNIAIGHNVTTNATNRGIAIGGSTGTRDYCINIGGAIRDSGGNYNVAIGGDTGGSSNAYCVALGKGSACTRTGEVNIKAGGTHGYNSTAYRVLGGVHDPIDAHDAATKGYVDANAGGAITKLTSADFNWNSTTQTATEPYDMVALWLLEPGLYDVSGLTFGTEWNVYKNAGGNENNYSLWLVAPIGYGSQVNIYGFYGNGSAGMTSANEGFIQCMVSTHSSSLGNLALETRYLNWQQIKTTTGNSDYAVMTQNAVTSMVFSDPVDKKRIQIGQNAAAGQSTNGEVVIGYNSKGRNDTVSVGYNAGTNDTQRDHNVNLGSSAQCGSKWSVSLGAYARTTRQGEVNVGTGSQTNGYNSTSYRVIGGVHDGQDTHDAVTVEQVNATIDAINTALSTSIPHIGAAS